MEPITVKQEKKRQKRQQVPGIYGYVELFIFFAQYLNKYLNQSEMVILNITCKDFQWSNILIPSTMTKIKNVNKIGERVGTLDMLIEIQNVLQLPLNVVFFLTKQHSEYLNMCIVDIQGYFNNGNITIMCQQPNGTIHIIKTLCLLILRFSHYRKNIKTFLPFFDTECKHWMKNIVNAYSTLLTLSIIFNVNPKCSLVFDSIKNVFKQTIPVPLSSDTMIETIIFKITKQYWDRILDTQSIQPIYFTHICNILEICDNSCFFNLEEKLFQHLKNLRDNNIGNRFLIPTQIPEIVCKILEVFKYLPNPSYTYIPLVFEIIQNMEDRIGIDDDIFLFRKPLLDLLNKSPDILKLFCKHYASKPSKKLTSLAKYILNCFGRMV
jgi:hypothetical protein